MTSCKENKVLPLASKHIDIINLYIIIILFK